MRPCFAFSAASAPEAPATLSIYDEIGFWGVQAADFRSALSAIESAVLDVEINSPGGDVFAGLAIYNMLRSSGKTINMRVMGVAASAASLIAMAGDTIAMPSNTFMMIHNPYWGVRGNAAELRDSADALEKIQASLTATYVAKTGIDTAEMEAMLSKDTWLTADECLKMGFCTEVIDPVVSTAKYDLARAELPEHVKLLMAPVAAIEEVVEDEPLVIEPVIEPLVKPLTGVPLAIHTLVVSAGFEAFAPEWAVAYALIPDVEARVASARSITELCTMARRPADAALHIKANASDSTVRAALLLAMAKDDEATHVDTSQDIQKTQTARSNANPKATVSKIWDSHNAQKRKP